MCRRSALGAVYNCIHAVYNVNNVWIRLLTDSAYSILRANKALGIHAAYTAYVYTETMYMQPTCTLGSTLKGPPTRNGRE